MISRIDVCMYLLLDCMSFRHVAGVAVGRVGLIILLYLRGTIVSVLLASCVENSFFPSVSLLLCFSAELVYQRLPTAHSWMCKAFTFQRCIWSVLSFYGRRLAAAFASWEPASYGGRLDILGTPVCGSWLHLFVLSFCFVKLSSGQESFVISALFSCCVCRDSTSRLFLTFREMWSKIDPVLSFFLSGSNWQTLVRTFCLRPWAADHIRTPFFNFFNGRVKDHLTKLLSCGEWLFV